jgi:hypothetical protein
LELIFFSRARSRDCEHWYWKCGGKFKEVARANRFFCCCYWSSLLWSSSIPLAILFHRHRLNTFYVPSILHIISCTHWDTVTSITIIETLLIFLNYVLKYQWMELWLPICYVTCELWVNPFLNTFFISSAWKTKEYQHSAPFHRLSYFHLTTSQTFKKYICFCPYIPLFFSKKMI